MTDDSIVFVTGASGTVGTALCLHLARCGYKVVGLSRSTPGYEHSSNLLSILCDVTDESSFQSVLEEYLDSETRFAALVNCACVRPMDSVSSSIASWQFSTTQNSLLLYVPTMLFTRKLLNLSKSGSVATVSSIYGVRGPKMNIYRDSPFELEPDYAYNKAASLGLMRYLASYYAQSNIRFNSIILGGVFNNQDQSFLEHYSDRCPMGRLCSPTELGSAVEFLIDPSSTYITGSELAVDGGWTSS